MTKNEVEQMDDEIDILELVKSLWKEKVLIVAITAVIIFIGLGYSLFYLLTYVAKVELLPPSISNITEINK